MDYVLVYLAWGLDLSDLKQLLLNTIEYASIWEAQKVKLRELFEHQWYKFLIYVKGRH